MPVTGQTEKRCQPAVSWGPPRAGQQRGLRLRLEPRRSGLGAPGEQRARLLWGDRCGDLERWVGLLGLGQGLHLCLSGKILGEMQRPEARPEVGVGTSWPCDPPWVSTPHLSPTMTFKTFLAQSLPVAGKAQAMRRFPSGA